MLLTKNAVKNLINKYKAVLINCRLLNIFGTLAIAGGIASSAITGGIASSAITGGIASSAITVGIASAALTLGVPSVALADVVGIEVNQPDPWGSSGTITASSSTETAVGIKATGTTNNITLKSGGSITVQAEGNNHAYGMVENQANATNNFTNAGSMSITLNGNTANAYGMHGSKDKVHNTFINAGSMSLTAHGNTLNIYGMYGVAITNTFMNADSMSVTVKGNTVNAYGMQGAGGEASNTFTNVGTITITTEGMGWAYGMKTDGGKANTFTNTGTMTITGKKTGTAYGMCGNGSKANNFSNTGTMTIASSGLRHAYGMHGNSATANNFNNSGIMTVSAGDKRTAYGMWVSGPSTLHNSGSITVSGCNAYQAYVESGTAHIGTWTLKLAETYGAAGVGYHVFGAGSGGTLIFGEGGKGATLVISGLGDAFVNGTEYPISGMVDLIGGTAKGYIENVTSSYAFLEVELVDKGLTSDYTDQYIKGVLNVTEDNSPAQAVTAQTLSGMRNNMHQLRNIIEGQTRATGERLDFSKRKVGGEAQSPTATMYASASSSVSDAGMGASGTGLVPDADFVPDAAYLRPAAPAWETFLTPYYSQYGANNASYDGHVHGIAMGATRTMTKDFALGAHFGLSKGTSDSALTDTDTTTYTLGVHAVYSVGDALFFRGQLSGFIAENDIDMLGSSAKRTRAITDMGTSGLYAMLAAGYDIMLAPEHFLTPEFGLSYFYAHLDGFDADFCDTAGTKDAAIGMARESYDVWYTDATLRWTGIFAMDKGTLKPTVKAGIRQALSNPDVSSTMFFGSASGASASSATTHSDANDTAFLCEAGLAWEYDGITLSATYAGEFGNIEHSHMAMFKAEWTF